MSHLLGGPNRMHVKPWQALRLLGYAPILGLRISRLRHGALVIPELHHPRSRKIGTDDHGWRLYISALCACRCDQSSKKQQSGSS
ncbi:hypothetical protein GCM10011385_30280 [Nitratireductor aestuarii]|uniref:Uncharacterized protein n=1 Tax=Nitratireductor aestuarii TaxID=1735103 RepID=A0A916RZA2_9HYPH|nr:hypothetical protein GCM10011385_30280 [Nitratireductor aestuarii]